MGSCISTGRGSMIFKKTNFRKNHSKRRLNENSKDHLSSKNTTNSSIGCVLPNPNEGNIHEKYKLGRELGRGEFGITHQCFDVDSGEEYACKIIAKQNLRTEIDRDDVKREVEIMRRLPRHHNIVTFKEAYEDKEAIYLVMELCGGGELFDRIVARGHYTERAAAKVTKTILQIVKVN